MNALITIIRRIIIIRIKIRIRTLIIIHIE